MWNYNLGLEFNTISKKYPTNTAFIIENKSYTYEKVNFDSTNCAGKLQNLGLKLGDRVCITSKKQYETFVSFLACLKLGVTYSFVDRHTPIERYKNIINILKPSLIICDFILEKTAKEADPKIPRLELSEINIQTNQVSYNFENHVRAIPSNTIAYIMFTSGSTGVPNGVAVTHRNVIEFRNWGVNEYKITDNERITNLNSLFFDNSVFDLYMSLFTGATIIPFERDDLKDPNQIVSAVEKTNATIWFSVPSLIIYLLNFRSITKTSFPNLKKIIFGGEGFAKNKLHELYQFIGDRIDIVNVYGPTEGTCICSSYKISERDFSNKNMKVLAPLGHIAPNFNYIILDKNNTLVTNGTIGELCIGGENISKGYYGNPQKTKEKFIQNPNNQHYIEIIYKTGDLVKIDESGFLNFCGRTDSQIKFMGYRIELGEIETALSSFHEIKESVVLFGERNSVQEITCFLCTDLNKNTLKQELEKILPTYMIPRKFVYMNILPKNSNGKIDRKKLKEEYYD